MRSIRTAFVAAAVLGAFSTAWAGDPPPVKNPWEGFGVGSTVTEKTTASAPICTVVLPPGPAIMNTLPCAGKTSSSLCANAGLAAAQANSAAAMSEHAAEER